jgi:hydrogenase maturation protease
MNKQKNTTKIITILGVGNILMSDEGFGVRVVEYLQADYHFPAGVELLDGGTSGIYLAPVIEDSRCLLIIDVLNMKGPAGEIHLLAGDELRGAGLQTSMSPHQAGLLEIIDLCRLRDKAPDEIKIIGIIPQDLSLSLELSPTLRDKVKTVADIVIKQIEEWTNARVIPGSGPAQPTP